MTTTLAQRMVWGTVALFFALFAFMFIYTGATWDTQAIKTALGVVLFLVVIGLGLGGVALVIDYGTRGYRWSK